MIVVLSGLRTSLETELSGRGEDFVTVVPETVYAQRLKDDPPYGLMSVPSWDNYAALAQLADELQSRHVTNLVTIDEPAVCAAAFLRDLLGIDGLAFASAARFTDKALMKKRLAQARIPIAPYRLVHTLDDIVPAGDIVGWPIVVKPRIGASTVNTHIIRDKDHLGDLVAMDAFAPVANIPEALKAAGIGARLDQTPEGFLVEKYVDVAYEYNCEVFMHRGTAVYAIPGRYSDVVIHAEAGTFGTAILEDGPTTQALKDLATRAASALGLEDGFAHCELFEDRDGRFLIGEIGARPGGVMIPHLLKLQHGINVMALQADLALGREPSLEWRTRPTLVALKGVPAPTGHIGRVTPLRDMRQLPGVVDVFQLVAVGESTNGAVGTAASAFAGIVFCEGASSQQAMGRAEYAASQWEFCAS